MINTVKQQQNGWLVNGSMSVPNDKSNRHYQEVQEWLKTNTPEPEFTFTELQTAKISELTAAYNAANETDIAYMNTTFQANKKSQELITGILAGGGAVPSGFTWRDKLNVDVPMTFADLQGLSQAIVARGQVNWVKYQGLKAKVSLSTTQSDLDTIVW